MCHVAVIMFCVQNLVNKSDYKEDSLDSEGIFDLEGMDSSTPPHIDHNSDAYDSDTDGKTTSLRMYGSFT